MHQTEAIAARFKEEWKEVRLVLNRNLSVSDQRSILGQLIIVANGQTSSKRAQLMEAVVTRLEPMITSKQDWELVVDHLREFARLRSDQRRLFGKVLFEALSQLHGATPKKKAKARAAETSPASTHQNPQEQEGSLGFC